MSISAIKKGETVVMLGFTGMRLGDFKVSAADKTSITITKVDGKEMVFSRKTGKQTNVAEGKEKYANSIVHPDDAPKEKPKKKPAKDDKKKAAAAPSKKKSAPVEEDDEEEDDEDEEDEEEDDEEPVQKKKKKAATASGGAIKKKKPVEDDEDFDDV